MAAIQKIINQVRDFQTNVVEDHNVFFRGQRSEQKLLPSLLRNKSRYNQEIEIVENNLFCDAWVMGANELLENANSWELLAQFQHYQIPTRLLDWTSSLISAIFFSISNCLNCVSYRKEEKCRNL
jgi:hypothetical protein